MIFSEDPDRLVEFYAKIFEMEPDWADESFSGFQVGSCHLMIGPHDKVKGASKNPERIMFNLETEEVETEFARMKKAGAKVIAEPYKPDEEEDYLIATLADPDGNYFQLMSPYE